MKLTPSTSQRVVRQLFGNQRILLVYNPDPLETLFSPSIEADTWRVITSYALAFPNRHPKVVLASSAYNIIYLGPQTFHAGHGTC